MFPITWKGGKSRFQERMAYGTPTCPAHDAARVAAVSATTTSALAGARRKRVHLKGLANIRSTTMFPSRSDQKRRKGSAPSAKQKTEPHW